jgi:hypothetical protein
METKKFSKSTRIFVRREKSRIRHTVTDLAEQKKLIDELTQRLQ